MQLWFRRLRLLGTFAIISMQINAVLSRVYPTQPTANTTFVSGRPALLEWKDDRHKPHVADLEHIKIDLCYNSSIYVATLAKDIVPTAYSQLVSIPSGLPSRSNYVLHFIASPHITVYSADFTITNENYILSTRTALTNATASSTSAGPSTTPTNQTNPIGIQPGPTYHDSDGGARARKNEGRSNAKIGMAFVCPLLTWLSFYSIWMVL